MNRGSSSVSGGQLAPLQALGGRSRSSVSAFNPNQTLPLKGSHKDRVDPYGAGADVM